MAGHEIEKGEVNVQTPTERLHDDIRKSNEEEKDCTDPVSYTHLTLPTICSV